MISALPPNPPAHILQGSLTDPFKLYGGSLLTVDPFATYGGRKLAPSVEGRIQFHEKFMPLFRPARYKVGYGGRGGIKSWSFARALLILGQQRKLRIVCGREFMSSIDDSVHKLLSDQIDLMGLGPWYTIGKKHIYGANGTTISYIGLGDMAKARRRSGIKSFESIDILWVEEAENISERTWEITIPTIRKTGSEIWITYNPNLASDATYKRFHPDGRGLPPGTVLIHTSWRDNLWFSDEMRQEKDHLYLVDPEAAAHVWDGHLREHADAQIFGPSMAADGVTMIPKYIVHSFEPPENVRYFHGIDWGFSVDPFAIVRCWTTGTMPNEELWIDMEGWGIGVEINVMDEFIKRTVPTATNWPILADNARPELISYMRGLGYSCDAADKWSGCLEDGIAHLRGMNKIHIHPRCRHMIDEARDFKYKIDPMTQAVLPIVVEKHDHLWSAVRYALDGYIQRRGSIGVWQTMGRQMRGGR